MLANRDLNVDPETGAPFFQPKTFSAHKKKASGGSQIFEELYQQKDRKELVVRRLLEKENYEIQIKSFKPLEISSKIVLIKRRTAMEELFRDLDADNDGEISTENMDISKIDNKKLIILAPFFCWMENNGLKFGEEQFVDEVEKFTRTLDLRDTHEVFN